MRYYSLSEVMQDLHINNHRLYRLLEVACISPIAHKHDKRLKLISEEEYARIKAEHEASLDALGWATDASEAQRALIARVAELEADNARLKRLSEQHMPPTGESALSPTSDATAPTARHYSAVQLGYQYDEHGVMAKGSVGRLIALHSGYNEDYGRKFLAGKIVEDQRMGVESILTWLRSYLSHVGRAADWHTCTDDACPCDAL